LPAAKPKEYLIAVYKHRLLSRKEFLSKYFAVNCTSVWRMVAKLWFRKLCVIFSNTLYISVYRRGEFKPNGMEGGRSVLLITESRAG